MDISKDDSGYIIVKNDNLQMEGWGETIEEAKKEFFDMFDNDYQSYALCEDGLLSEAAIEQKNKLLKLVKKYINNI